MLCKHLKISSVKEENIIFKNKTKIDVSTVGFEMASVKQVTGVDSLEAYDRLKDLITKTPVHTSTTLDNVTGRKVFVKCENFQKTGSAKARGALNAVLNLKARDPNCPGVVAYTSGNHGQGLAWACTQAHIPCTIIVPYNTTPSKIQAIRDYGAEVVTCNLTSPQVREDLKEKLTTEGKVFISPYDHCDVIAGQGTIAVEFLSQCPDLDAIIVPICGGGITAGIAIATAYLSPKTKVFAVEPEGKNLGPSLEQGKWLWEGKPHILNTIAEGMRLSQVGQVTFPYLCKYLHKQVFTVSDAEITEAMRFVYGRMKLVAEASSSMGVAAVMSEAFRKLDPSIQNVGVILCGGNTNLDCLPWQTSVDPSVLLPNLENGVDSQKLKKENGEMMENGSDIPMNGHSDELEERVNH